MKLAVVIPVGPDRQNNLNLVLEHLARQNTPLEQILTVLDGDDVESTNLVGNSVDSIRLPKHKPGMEQPRNVGVRQVILSDDAVTHVAFLDSDVMVDPMWHDEILTAYELGVPERIMACPYDWLPAGRRHINDRLRNDPRWKMFENNGPEVVFVGDISAGLACFSGNLVWPTKEFIRVGGFWSELHHGRCEDGELGLRAVSMGVPISFAAKARGWHLWHPVNLPIVLARNERDVPMLNARHPWVQGSGVVLVDRDGKAFDVRCPSCKELISTGIWWNHAYSCAGSSTIPIKQV